MRRGRKRGAGLEDEARGSGIGWEAPKQVERVRNEVQGVETEGIRSKPKRGAPRQARGSATRQGASKRGESLRNEAGSSRGTR